MTRLEEDVESARRTLLDAAIALTNGATAYTKASDAMIDKMRVLLMCADLPGDMALRVRLFPNAFGLEA